VGKRKTRQYTLEFKQQAATLANSIGVSRAAHQLGVPVTTVYDWQKKPNTKSHKLESKKNQVNLEEQNRLLRKENDELKKVNHILKKAAAFFSQDHLK